MAVTIGIAIKTFSIGLFSHVLEEEFIAVSPPITDLDASTPIPMVAVVVWVIASLPHSLPGLVGGRFPVGVLAAAMLWTVGTYQSGSP